MLQSVYPKQVMRVQGISSGIYDLFGGFSILRMLSGALGDVKKAPRFRGGLNAGAVIRRSRLHLPQARTAVSDDAGGSSTLWQALREA